MVLCPAWKSENVVITGNPVVSDYIDQAYANVYPVVATWAPNLDQPNTSVGRIYRPNLCNEFPHRFVLCPGDNLGMAIRYMYL